MSLPDTGGGEFLFTKPVKGRWGEAGGPFADRRVFGLASKQAPINVTPLWDYVERSNKTAATSLTLGLFSSYQECEPSLVWLLQKAQIKSEIRVLLDAGSRTRVSVCKMLFGAESDRWLPANCNVVWLPFHAGDNSAPAVSVSYVWPQLSSSQSALLSAYRRCSYRPVVNKCSYIGASGVKLVLWVFVKFCLNALKTCVFVFQKM